MGANVTFSSPITCPVTQPGSNSTGSTQCAAVSTPANVTASISADTSGGAFKLLSLTSFVIKKEIETPDPGELGPGVTPKPVPIDVAVQVAQSNGVTPLAVASGQYVVATVQFAPTSSTPDACTANLLINGDAWNPVTVPISATVAEISVKVPAISVVQGKSVTVDVTLTLVAGAATTAKLILDADGSSAAPNVTAALNTTSLSLTKGTPVSAKLTVSAGPTLATGTYSWSLAVWYDSTASFSGPVNITVDLPYFAVKSKLNGNVIDISGASTKAGAGLDAYTQKTTGNDNQLWYFMPDGSGYYQLVSKLNGNVIDIEGASTKAGALLDAYTRKTSDNDNQLWYFVADPAGSGACFIVSKLNGNVIDIANASTAAGAALDAYPVKFTDYDNQLWTVVDGSFPSVVDAISLPAGLGNGNVNFFLGAASEALYGLNVTVKFSSDFVSSANGYSFQLNCYSTEGPTIHTEWQQFVIYASPGDTQLVARIDTWSGTSASDELNRIDVNLANLPSPTIPKDYSLHIALTYLNGDSAIISGANYSVTDNHGNSVGTANIQIVGQTLRTTGNPATEANLAPIAALQFTIGGDYGGSDATLSTAAGTITYNASVGLSAQPNEPSYTDFNDGTAENANLRFGWLPWPWSINMESDEPSLSITQTFAATSTAATPRAELELLTKRTGHVLPPPDDQSRGRRAASSGS